MSEGMPDRLEYESYEYAPEPPSSDGVDIFEAERKRHNGYSADSNPGTRYRTELLSAEQEIELGRAVQAGIKAERLLIETPRGAANDENYVELEATVRAGIEARNALVQANLRLVQWTAAKFLGKGGLEYEDLVQSGIGAVEGVEGPLDTGLMHAAEMYDPDRGIRFSTYAKPWISTAIRRSIDNQGSLVRLPSGIQEELIKLSATRNRLNAELQRQPTEDELSTEIKCTRDKLRELEKTERAYWRTTSIASLDLELGDSENLTLGSITPDNTYAPATETHMESLDLRQAIGSLSVRKQIVVQMVFEPKADGTMASEREIADRLGYTVPAMRQDLRTALDQLKEALGNGYLSDEAYETGQNESPRSQDEVRRRTNNQRIAASSSNIMDIKNHISAVERLDDEEQQDILELIAMGLRPENSSDVGLQARVVLERQRLVLEYSSLVMKRVYDCLRDFPRDDPDELTQAGFLALTEAINSYALVGNKDKATLGGYAGEKVMQSIRRTSLSMKLATELPGDSFTQHNVYRYLRARHEVFESDGQVHPPDAGALIEVSPQDSYALERLTSRPYRLVDPEDRRLKQHVVNDEAAAEEIENDPVGRRALLEQALLLMPPKEAALLSRMYGISGGPTMTPEEIDTESGYAPGTARTMINYAKKHMVEVAGGLADSSLDLKEWVRKRPALKNELTFIVRANMPVPGNATREDLRKIAIEYIASRPYADERTVDILFNMYGLSDGPSVDYKVLAKRYDINERQVTRLEERFFKGGGRLGRKLAKNAHA